MPDTPDDAFINGSVEGSRFDHRGEPTMPDTLSREELDGHRAYLALHRPDCQCTGSRLLAHLDALTAAVEDMHNGAPDDVPSPALYWDGWHEALDKAVAILRGEQ
jgi:hypothetical protein